MQSSDSFASPSATCKSEPGSFAPVVDRSKCEGNAKCVEVCPVHVFEVRRIDESDFAKLGVFPKFKSIAHGRKTAYTPRASACEACGKCVEACPRRPSSSLGCRCDDAHPRCLQQTAVEVRQRKGFVMGKLGVRCSSVSVDGFGAGPNQDLQNPLGVGGLALHDWILSTRTFQKVHGTGGGAAGIDEDFAARGFAGIGARILGRNMFGPIRGPWPDEAWKGWWGENPPYHTPVFVLTHHARPSVTMDGGTTFHFVTGGIHEALARAP